jgi:hypothetical protein
LSFAASSARSSRAGHRPAGQNVRRTKLISLSLFLTGISLILLPFIKGDGQLKWLAVLRATDWPWIKMLLALALLAVGSALTRPPLFGLLSNLAPANEQGATIGVAQSAGSLARILGPLFAATLYTARRIAALRDVEAFWKSCGVISILAESSAQKHFRRRIRETQSLPREVKLSGEISAQPRSTSWFISAAHSSRKSKPVVRRNSSNGQPAFMRKPNAAVSPARFNGGNSSLDSMARFPFSSCSQ